MEMRWAASHLSTCTCSMPNCPSASGCCLSCSEFKFRLIRFEDRVEAFPMLGSIALWATVRKMTFYRKVETRRSSCPECMEVVNCVLLAAAAETDRRLWQNLVHSSLPCLALDAAARWKGPTLIRYVFTLLGDNTLLRTLRNTVTHWQRYVMCLHCLETILCSTL